MERDPADRLGSNGAQEVKDAAFFIVIDFDKLLRKELPVPYKPNILAEDDIQVKTTSHYLFCFTKLLFENVDDDFLGEPIYDAP